MIEAILERRSSLLRHKQAPLFEERERFLAQLHQQGTSRKSLRNMAGELIQVTRLLRLEKLRDVDLQEIDRASRMCAQEQRSNPKDCGPAGDESSSVGHGSGSGAAEGVHA